jgi:hypothetical protein
MDGDAPGAAKCFARLMDRTPDFAARLKLAEQIQKGSTDLADLEVLRPDDPVFEWLRWRRKFRESADTTNVGQPVEGFLEYLEQTREIDLRMLYDVPEFHSVVEQAGFEQLLEARLAQSTPSVRQQVWTKQPPQPFAAQLQRSRDGITELIAKLDSEGLCPVFLGTSPLSINSVPNFVVRWTSDPRDHRLRLKLTRQQLDELLKTPSEGMELVSLEEYRDGKETLYAALWVKQVTAAPWGLHERLNESATRQLAASMRERGFRPTYVNAYPDGTFTTVWVRDDGRSELLLGLTYQDLMDLQQRRAADCLPTGIDSHFDGRRRRYCVIVDSSIKGVEWKFTLLTRDSEIQSVSNGNFEAGWKMLATTDAPVGSAMAGAH